MMSYIVLEMYILAILYISGLDMACASKWTKGEQKNKVYIIYTDKQNELL